MADDSPSADVIPTKGAIYTARRSFAGAPVGRLAKALDDAKNEYLRMRDDGVSREDACKGLELILRDMIPLTKYPPRCDKCDDHGWEVRTCESRMRCGRQRCAEGHPAFEHSYAVPCLCPAGDKFRRQAAKFDQDDAIAAAAKTRKAKAKGWQHV